MTSSARGVGGPGGAGGGGDGVTRADVLRRAETYVQGMGVRAAGLTRELIAALRQAEQELAAREADLREVVGAMWYARTLGAFSRIDVNEEAGFLELLERFKDWLPQEGARECLVCGSSEDLREPPRGGPPFVCGTCIQSVDENGQPRERE